MTDTRGVVVRQEVAREGRVADDVRAARVQDDVVEVGDAALDEFLARGVGDEAHVLAEQEEVDELVLAAGLLDEMGVYFCEGGAFMTMAEIGSSLQSVRPCASRKVWVSFLKRSRQCAKPPYWFSMKTRQSGTRAIS